MCVCVCLSQCLNADGGHKADENCSKLTHIKGPLGLCSPVSATGDILDSETIYNFYRPPWAEPPLNPAGMEVTEELPRDAEGVDESQRPLASCSTVCCRPAT